MQVECFKMSATVLSYKQH